MLKKWTFAAGLAIILAASTLWGAYLRNFPISVSQPDGWTLDLFVTGDEYYHWMHDRSDYTIVVDPASGYYVYAVKGEDGELAPSPYIAGRIDPAALGLAKSLRRPTLKVRKETDEFIRNEVRPYVQPAPKTGNLNNLVVFVRFWGESEFTDPLSTYSSMFNTTTAGANSMHNYFHEASYNALSVSTTFYPTPGTTVVSYQDSHVRGYYQPYSASNTIGYTGGDNGTERRDREHILVKNAVNFISSQVLTTLNIDGDNDGYVDNICFIVSGSPDGWASLLWPHQWSLYSQTAYINSKQVYTYNFQLQASLASSGVGVLCHEMCHSLGAPDLYHYYYSLNIEPVYEWDIMEYDQNPPQHMGAYIKYKYMTWISSIPEITTAGIYTLHPLTSSTNNAYKIKSPSSATEYFVVEYRKQTLPFESSLPGSGLLVYRINTACSGNSNGPPDEVYIYRPNGTTTANGSPSIANYSSGVGRTSINDTTSPSSFLSNGSAGGLKISAVGTAGSTISFTVGFSTDLPPTVTITSPASSATVSGTVAVQATATDTVGINRVGFYIDSQLRSIDTAAPYSWSWVTKDWVNGAHTVKAIAYDTVGQADEDQISVTVNNAWVPPTIPFSESFSGGLTLLPPGWTQQNVGTGITPRWDVTAASIAGSIPNEARCAYQNINPGTSRLVTPAIITTGYTSLRLRFKHMLDTYSSGGLTLKVRTSPDGTTWTDEAWSVTTTAADIGPQTITTVLTHNLNRPTTYVAFEISGNLYNFWYWDIDDISIDHNMDYFKSSGSWTGAGHGTDGWYVGDFNGDGKDDIFRYVPGTSGADVLLSSGTKFVYSGSWTGAGHGTDGWYVGDFNGDGKDDIFRYVPGTSGADVFLSNGTRFVYSGSWTGAGDGTDGWYVGDFNGDGKDDIFRYVPGTSGADVLLSNGTRFVYSGSWAGAGHGDDGWYVGDFNGDNKDDIFRYVAGTSGADVLLSSGTKFVYSGSWTDAGHGTDGWYVGDFNGDGKDDIFRYVAGTSGADVFLSSTLAPSPSSANALDEGLMAVDADMMMDIQGIREGDLTPQTEDALMAPFVQRMMSGEDVPVYEIQKAYEQALGHCVRRKVVLQLIEKHTKK